MVFKSIIIFIACHSLVFATVTIKRYSISTYTNTGKVNQDIGVLSNNDESNKSNVLNVIRVAFRQYANPYINTSSLLLLDNRLTLADYLDPEIYGKPLMYPNPYRLSSTTPAILGYWLNQPLRLEVQIYNSFGRLILQRIIPKGAPGGRMGYNRVQLNSATFNYYEISAGIYFLYLIDENRELMGKTKIAIVP